MSNIHTGSSGGTKLAKKEPKAAAKPKTEKAKVEKKPAAKKATTTKAKPAATKAKAPAKPKATTTKAAAKPKAAPKAKAAPKPKKAAAPKAVSSLHSIANIMASNCSIGPCRRREASCYRQDQVRTCHQDQGCTSGEEGGTKEEGNPQEGVSLFLGWVLLGCL